MDPIKMLFLIFTSLAILNISGALGATLKCNFKIKNWYAVGEIYYCEVEDNDIFDGTRVEIDSIEGEHMSGYSNEDVKAVDIDSIPNVKLFPTKIHEHFENLIFLRIVNSDLQEFNQQDLQPYPNLDYFAVDKNQIKIIEKDAFKFNPHLKGIWLHNNRISHIDPEVFSDLSQLQYLALSNNRCKYSINNEGIGSTARDINQVENGDCVQPKVIEPGNITQDLVELFEARDENNKKFIQIQRKFSALVKTIEQNNEEINAKNAAMNREMSEKIENLTHENQQLKSDISVLKSKSIENQSKKLKSCETTVNELTKQNKDLAVTLQELNAKYVSLVEEKLAQSEKLVDKLLENNSTSTANTF